ncbi:MAG: outer membrane protein assembly factor BamA [Burkholderiaceae bacterium]|nr:MAG: outer membrane protein assembly factor BamA [Burkholderiaceae bacterium]
MLLRRKFHFTKRVVPVILAALLAPAIANAFTPFVVKDIRVDGIQRVDAGTVFSYLPVKVGQKFTDAQAAEAIQHLYATGFFSDVKIDTANDVLVVTVKERPTIASVVFNGMRAFDAKALNKALSGVGFGPGRVFDQSMLEQAIFQLKQQYLSKGKYAVEITPIITPLPRNRVGVSFDIYEGDVATIQQINFVGNKAFSQSTLEDELDLTTSGIMTWYTNTDKYSSEKLEGDVERIRSFYLDRGYLEFSSEPPQVTISPDRQGIYITFTIHEGKPYKVHSVKLAGDLLGLDDKIQKLVQIKAGETFSAAKSNATSKAITDYLGTLGYAFANVNPNPVLDREKHEADLTFYVDPGRRVYVRRIQIGGNTRTRDAVIRREMRQNEAAWYDSASIKTSRDRIDRLGYFTDVSATTAPVPGSNDQVDINVNVKEKPTGLISLGVGYGSTGGILLSGGISQDNIFGSGQSVSIQANTSQIGRAVVLAHTDPYWTKDGISKTTSLYYRRTLPYLTSGGSSSVFGQNQGNYAITSMGAGLNFGVPISEFDRVFAGVSYERNTIDLYTPPQAYQDFVDQYGRTTNAVIFNLGWSKDTRDSALAPTKGSYTRLAGNFSTMDLKYYQLSGQQQYFLPLGRSFTLAFNGTVDWGRSYGGKPFPIIKDVYGGGIGSVRGYQGGSLGPRDTITGDYLGGARRTVGSVQLYLPFPGTQHDKTLRWFVFADAGQVAPGNGLSCMAGIGNGIEDPCGWRYSAGIGLSWQSPMGPLELSFARALNAKQGDDKQAFQFQIGTGF